MWHTNKRNIEPNLTFLVQNQEDMRQILGAMNFYCRNVKGFTFDSAPLTDFLKMNVRWRWTERQESFLNAWKRKLYPWTCRDAISSGVAFLGTGNSDLGGGSV